MALWDIKHFILATVAGLDLSQESLIFFLNIFFSIYLGLEEL
jgi:hypothetical protein